MKTIHSCLIIAIVALSTASSNEISKELSIDRLNLHASIGGTLRCPSKVDRCVKVPPLV